MAGRPPFEAETAEEVAKRHISDRPPPLRSLCPNAQEQTVFTIDKCLAKKTDHRWDGYTELISQIADSLRRLLNN
jgi:hypothetical protein